MTIHVSFTGECPNRTREQLISLTKMAGYTYHSSICSKSTLLVASTTDSVKARRAAMMGLKVVDYGTFLKIAEAAADRRALETFRAFA